MGSLSDSLQSLFLSPTTSVSEVVGRVVLALCGLAVSSATAWASWKVRGLIWRRARKRLARAVYGLHQDGLLQEMARINARCQAEQEAYLKTMVVPKGRKVRVDRDGDANCEGI